MFDHTSRYANLPVHHYPEDDEQAAVAYVGRRFLPQGESLPVLLRLSCKAGDRLDQLAARALGDPALFWRIADANNAMNPSDLTATPGRELVVPTPQV